MADTLTLYYAMPALDSTASWGGQAQNAAEIFGPISTLSATVATTSSSISFVDPQATISWQNGLVLVALLSLFCYAVYRFGVLVRVGFKSLFSVDDTVSMFENATLEFKYFLSVGRILFLLSTAVIVDGVAASDYGLQIVAIPLIIGILLLASFLSSLMLKIASFFDYNSSRWVELSSLKKMDRGIAAIIFVLPALAFSYADVMHNALLGIVLVVVLIHFFRILIFFRQKGFSFLQWILYLCTVEIAPFALLWGVAVRLRGIHF